MKTLVAIFLVATSFAFGDIYLSLDTIFPAQHRYASMNVQKKMTKKIEQGDAWWNEVKGRWEYRYEGGLSIFSKKEALPVVKAPFGYVLTDGHHDVLSSIALGASLIPVKVIADLSSFDECVFWEEMEKHGFAYLYDLEGNRKAPPREFHLLQDDPNRYFAAISARKYPADGNIEKSVGAEYPLWLKVGKDIPFIEFKIADALWQHHIIYNTDMREIPEAFVEEARQALIEAKIQGLRVVIERTHYSELKVVF